MLMLMLVIVIVIESYVRVQKNSSYRTHQS